MSQNEQPRCPECDSDFDMPEFELDRRHFLRSAALAAAVPVAVGATGGLIAAEAKKAEDKPAEKKAKPAEDLIRELFSGLSEKQKKDIVLPWDHGAGKNRVPNRLALAPNRALLGKTIDKNYTKTQVELITRILKAISSGEDGFRRISRGGTWDASRSLGNCGALIFGDPSQGKKFSWLFTGHHMTVRCDGNSEEGAAFGGPMYYGHSPNGYSRSNLFYYQTKSVVSVYKALSEKQRKQSLITMGNPGEGEKSVKFKAKAEERPGIAFADLTKDQKTLVETVMRDVLSPYRKEDVDEVMEIVKKNGGMEKIQLAFFQDPGKKEDEPWNFWRLEGPGFVWNYRVLPHVHTYVNISSKLS